MLVRFDRVRAAFRVEGVKEMEGFTWSEGWKGI